MQNRAKFGVGIGVIVVALSFLAWLGYGESKTYYHTIAEYQSLNASDRARRMRLAGIVVEGSIKPGSGRVDFTLEEQGKTLPITYVGSDPLPDTFKDESQALADGSFGHDGVFHAKQLQAKCASKYAPQPGKTPGAQPTKTMTQAQPAPAAAMSN